ncbi:MAG: lipoyl synthase [Candidatus Zixiibacteriota bacterium]|nr:MAG: lipoyl synthase [candidate division Zixibacteria bacterium]
MRDSAKKPEWLKVKAFSGPGFDRVNRLLREHQLNTVCHAANCPNRGECFNRGTATFLILGSVCSRNCSFCDVRSGQPVDVDPGEPSRVAEMAAKLGLQHVVVTSVTRDDLPDGGASHFAKVVWHLRGALECATVEVLTPDFKGKRGAWDTVIGSAPDVFNHNVETVPRLYPEIRPQADYHRSLELLRYVRENSGITTKSGLMVGMGETLAELREVFRDVADRGVSILTIGQYLAPSKGHFPVHRYLHPEEFSEMEQLALQSGINKVFSAPLVRSSYLADLFQA